MHVRTDRQITASGHVVSHEYVVCVSVCVLGYWDASVLGLIGGYVMA